MNEKNLLSSSVCDPSATMKIKYNEMDKSELLEMLAFMQGELEAREVVIATLKSEKCKHLLYQAKYGRLNTALISPKLTHDMSGDNWIRSNTDSIFSIYDPFSAMQRDIQYVISGANPALDCGVDSNLKPVYDSQLNQLENLISSQKKAQIKMKEQIEYLEKKSVKLTQALEDERNKHERDAAQGDDVLVMLEKERERLKSELEFEKSHSRKLERELKRMVAVIEDQKIVIQNQRLAATVIMKTKKQIENDLRAVNVIINKSVNANDFIGCDSTMKHTDDVSDNHSNNMSGQLCANKNSFDRSHESIERFKDSSVPKSMKQNVHDVQSVLKPNLKYTQSKEQTPCVSVTLYEPNITLTNPVPIPIQKSRTGKQPESLLWKTYDPKNISPTSGHSPALSFTTKSPSNIRRQLPNVSSSNSIPASSLSRQNEYVYYKHPSAPSSVAVPSLAITPYQKILSTPPPSSIINQAASFQSSLTSYGIFNICSPSLPSHGNPVASVHKNAIGSTKPDCPPSALNSLRSRSVVNPIVVSSAASNSAMIRAGDASPAIPKHVYVNGK